jgi:uncharacterized membrane protein YraQ (UPF0718 family)
MYWKEELKRLAWILGIFLAVYFLPLGNARFDNAIMEALNLLKWYAREHVLLCLVPAFLIAGVIAVFISQGAVIRYFGPKAVKWKAYLVASVSGAILAVCSCTILPLFSSIHKKGAGLGPAVAFLYSGPAISILAMILTARILGWEIGLARIIGAVLFSVVIGLLMAFIFRKEEKEKADRAEQDLEAHSIPETRPFWQTSYHFFILVLILVFVNWGKPLEEEGLWYEIWHLKWWITAVFGLGLAYSLIRILKIKWIYVAIVLAVSAAAAFIFPANPTIAFVTATVGVVMISLLTPGDPNVWINESWWFTKQIMPLLGIGVLIAGLLLGGAGGEGLIPPDWISMLVGGNSLFSNAFASVFGAFMYFATLTEVPIVQGLLQNGMGQGPALALLLAGPALSLPNMLVIRSIMGTKKTFVFVALVCVMATVSGMVFGWIVG